MIRTVEGEYIKYEKYLLMAIYGAIDEPMYETEVEDNLKSDRAKRIIWGWVDFYKTNLPETYSKGNPEELTKWFNPYELVQLSKEELTEIDNNWKEMIKEL